MCANILKKKSTHEVHAANLWMRMRILQWQMPMQIFHFHVPLSNYSNLLSRLCYLHKLQNKGWCIGTVALGVTEVGFLPRRHNCSKFPMHRENAFLRGSIHCCTTPFQGYNKLPPAHWSCSWTRNQSHNPAHPLPAPFGFNCRTWVQGKTSSCKQGDSYKGKVPCMVVSPSLKLQTLY